ncbi:MAG: DUF2459 domain-containing protein [Natronospirillum sp.]
MRKLLIGLVMVFLPGMVSAVTTVQIIAHGWHTGVLIAAEAVRAGPLGFVPEVLGNADYYEFGWGDEQYYQEGEDRPSAFRWSTLA